MTSPRQQTLFEPEPTPWEWDDAQDRLVASVIFPRGPQQIFDYLVPAALRAEILAGQRVMAPFGRQNRLVEGYCVRLAPGSDDTRPLKSLDRIVEQRALVSPAMLELSQWMADYYLCAWGQVLDAMIPAGVRAQAGTRETRLVSMAPKLANQAEQKLTPTQTRIMRVLAERSRPTPIQQLAAAAGCTLGPIQTLVKRGLLQIETRRIDVGELAEIETPPESAWQLNVDQQRALAAIKTILHSGQHATLVLHGVTGSGKTEVYIQAIAETLTFGRQAIVLVPEISLTPQTEARFRSRFAGVAVLHSHQSDVERRRQWERIASGSVSVVVGARSAIFAPTPDLGLIVLDEEHETSFKQDSVPRYHARDVAIERARLEKIPLVLGSATPSLETWQRTQTGEFGVVTLPSRVYDRPLPAVGTIDLRSEYQDRRHRGAISRPLNLAIDAALKEGGQVILLLNRRGFSTHIQCPSCGEVCECPHCAIALTHHLAKNLAVCHYCGFESPAPTECPQCHFQGIHYRGLGTQRLEAEIKTRFPDFPCLRMDTDTMQKPGSHERALAAFRTGDVRILLGTQMIAKGLDFPNVTLVGVINADTALHLADYRAAERTFQLVTQVAGRTGRGPKGGRVLVQTFSPEHMAIEAAIRHDYLAFAAAELPLRARYDYPPFARMIRLVIRSPREISVSEYAEELARRLRAAMARATFKWRVLGPAPAPIAKLRGNFRFQIQVQGSDGAALRQAVRDATLTLKTDDSVQWMADVDPQDML